MSDQKNQIRNTSGVNLGQQIHAPIRSLTDVSKKMTSVGKFYNSMKKKIVSDAAMTEKMAKVVSIRAAVGTDLGVSSKKEKTFFKEMGKAGFLSARFKRAGEYNALLAKEQYHAAVAASAPGESAPKPAEIEELPEANAHPENNPEEERRHRFDTHKRMQRIRDEIEEQKKSHQDHEVSATNNYGAEARKQTTTSIAHPGSATPTSEAPEKHITHVGVDTRQANVVGSINQLSGKHATRSDLNPINPNIFGGPIKAANDNTEIPKAANDNTEDDVPEARFAQLD